MRYKSGTYYQRINQVGCRKLVAGGRLGALCSRIGSIWEETSIPCWPAVIWVPLWDVASWSLMLLFPGLEASLLPMPVPSSGSIASYILPSITHSIQITKGIQVNHMRRLVLVNRRIGIPVAATQIQSWLTDSRSKWRYCRYLILPSGERERNLYFSVVTGTHYGTKTPPDQQPTKVSQGYDETRHYLQCV